MKHISKVSVIKAQTACTFDATTGVFTGEAVDCIKEVLGKVEDATPTE